MEPVKLDDGRFELRLSVDYGLDWPLSDVYGRTPVDWSPKLSADLIRRLRDWCAFFKEHADFELGLFGSESKRKWFDLEGVALAHELDRQVGREYKVVLDLWF